MTGGSKDIPLQLSRRVVFQPDSLAALGRGITQIVEVVRPTFGPLPRLTAVEASSRNRTPEFLDDSGSIARRIIAIVDRDADMGAMLMRHTLWNLRQEVGDGVATAAVLCQAIFNEGQRYAAAGGNVMVLKSGLERGMRLVYDHLGTIAAPLQGEERIAHFAESVCHNRPLARMMGEIFDIIGEYGYLELRTSNQRGLDREYVEGAYWKSGWLSPHLITDSARREARLHDAAILITNLKIVDVTALARILELVFRNGCRSLMVLAQEMSDSALALLLLNQEKKDMAIAAAKAPKGVPGQMWGLEDIATLTGGRALLREAGETLDNVKWEDLGRARRTWATPDHFGLVGGRGNPNALRRHILSLQKSLPNVKDANLRKQTKERVGRLMGGSALLWVGGVTESEIKFRKELAERTALSVRVALRNGTVPGGGIAYLNCRRVLTNRATNAEERVAFDILSRALAAPARTILQNAGYEEPDYILAQAEQAGSDYGFDVRTGHLVNMREAGIEDSVAVLQAALRAGTTTAGLALSTDVLVHHAKPEESIEP